MPARFDACELFVGLWNLKIEKVLVNRKDDVTPINELCNNITKACVYEDDEFKLDEEINSSSSSMKKEDI